MSRPQGCSMLRYSDKSEQVVDTTGSGAVATLPDGACLIGLDGAATIYGLRREEYGVNPHTVEWTGIAAIAAVFAVTFVLSS